MKNILLNVVVLILLYGCGTSDVNEPQKRQITNTAVQMQEEQPVVMDFKSAEEVADETGRSRSAVNDMKSQEEIKDEQKTVQYSGKAMKSKEEILDENSVERHSIEK